MLVLVMLSELGVIMLGAVEALYTRNPAGDHKFHYLPGWQM